MALRKTSIFLYLSFLITSLPSESKIVLPELLAKQAISNIRFLSNDGKFTYYQKRSGSLLFSSNYQVIEVIQGKLGTQYTLFGSPARKKIVALQNQDFHTYFSVRNLDKIFLIDFGGTKVRELGNGATPALHLNDTWVSYYNYNKKTITFENTESSALKFNIKLNNRINPYFSPQVVMSDDNTIYYTDLSENGSVGLLEFKRNLGKSELIFKGENPLVKAEICLSQNNLILGLFGLNFSNYGSNIFKIPLPLKDFSKRENIYSSKENDIGQLLCDYDKNITFIKNHGTTEKPQADLVDLDMQSKKITFLSELKTITSVINMDGTLLALDKGKYYIVKGNIDFKNVDTFKSLPPDAATEAIKNIDDLNKEEDIKENEKK